jgi:hypothetical protein
VVVVREGPDGPCGGRDEPLRRLDELPQRPRLERRKQEREVQGEVELVLARPVERCHVLHREDVRLAEQDPARLVRVRKAAPAAEDLVRGGNVHAELEVLGDLVSHVDSKPGHSAVEPKAEDPVERLANRRRLPVEVGLLGKEVVQVVLPGAVVERPRWAAERRFPFVGRRAVGPRVGPDVPAPPRRVPGGARLKEPRMAVARVRGDEVEEETDPTRSRLLHEAVEIGERPEVGVDVAVVGDVVAPVGVWRGHRRVQPKAVDAEPLEVREARDEAR